MTLLQELKLIEEKSAIIIHGNSKYEDKSKKLYLDLEKILKASGYDKIEHDPGLDYTEPKKADVWIGFSRGENRLKFGPKNIKKISIGGTMGDYNISNPKDSEKCINDICIPNKHHFILTDKMKEELKKVI